MKKLFALILVLALALAAAGASADPEDMAGQILPDFTAKTWDGNTFTLSESLKTHDLVLINFWATWCGPCRMEFPYLEQAWEAYGDRVDVVALSVEPGDSFSTLKSFAKENGLNFAIGRDDNGMFDSMGGMYIPTTLIVNKDRRVVNVEVGTKTSVAEFTDLFDSLLASVPAPEPVSEPVSVPDQDQASGRCVITFRDPQGNPLAGVTVAFCNGEYTPVETDESGCIIFDGSPKEYHLHLLGVPAGYEMPWEQLQVSGESYDLTVTLYPQDGGD